MTDDFTASSEFADFFFLAIDHGFASVEDGGGPLIPFAMTVGRNGERVLTRFAMERLELGVARAREFVAEHLETTAMYALAWDGFVTLHGERTDAVLVEAADRSEANAVLFCQRYAKTKSAILRRTKCHRIGNPALIGRPPSLYAGGG
ncbi:MAG: hypothetical protein U0X73_17455 [Thermoanaerobaculia bacterium]